MANAATWAVKVFVAGTARLGPTARSSVASASSASGAPEVIGDRHRRRARGTQGAERLSRQCFAVLE
jgi:hypothetical protein